MSGRILKKTVRSILKSQIRNKSMVQVAIRSVLWSYPFCCNNISLYLSMQISGRTLKKIVWLVLETQLRNRYMVRSLIRKQWGKHDLFLLVTLQQLWPSSFCITKAFLVASYCFLFCRKNIEKQAVPMLCRNFDGQNCRKINKKKKIMWRFLLFSYYASYQSFFSQ